MPIELEKLRAPSVVVAASLGVAAASAAFLFASPTTPPEAIGSAPTGFVLWTTFLVFGFTGLFQVVAEVWRYFTSPEATSNAVRRRLKRRLGQLDHHEGWVLREAARGTDGTLVLQDGTPNAEGAERLLWAGLLTDEPLPLIAKFPDDSRPPQPRKRKWALTPVAREILWNGSWGKLPRAR